MAEPTRDELIERIRAGDPYDVAAKARGILAGLREHLVSNDSDSAGLVAARRLDRIIRRHAQKWPALLPPQAAHPNALPCEEAPPARRRLGFRWLRSRSGPSKCAN